MVRETFEQLWVAFGDPRSDLPEHRHITLAMAAHAHLTTVRADELKKGAQNPLNSTLFR